MSALSTIAVHQYHLDLGFGLPRSQNYEECERRMTTAVEAFEVLAPGNAWEGRLAVQTVLAAARAADCLREANRYTNDFGKMSRCIAQASSLMRESRAARRMLLQEQKVRQAVTAVADRSSGQPMAASAPAQAASATPAASAPVQPTASAPARPAAPNTARPAIPPTVIAPKVIEPTVSAPTVIAAGAPGAAVAPVRTGHAAVPSTKAALLASTTPAPLPAAGAVLSATGARPGNAVRIRLDKAA
jgi:hypothetical protein